MKLATFKRGGVHPADRKELSKDKAIERLPMPSELIVSMSQHLGAPATPLKKKGDTVRKGEVIGSASSYVSADVHSPADGVVTDVRKVRVASGAVADAIVIKCDEEQSNPFTESYDWRSESSEELLKLIRAMGIVGMGGATFPTDVKLTVPMGKKVDALVINGVECEPYLTSDYRLMMEHPEELLEGTMAAAKILNPDQIIIGIGINLSGNDEDIPTELSGKMGFLFPEGKSPVTRAELAARVADNLVRIQGTDFMDEYRRRCFIIGRDITVIKPGKGEWPATAYGVDDNGHLLVRYPDGREEALSSGEVTLRI